MALEYTRKEPDQEEAPLGQCNDKEIRNEPKIKNWSKRLQWLCVCWASLVSALSGTFVLCTLYLYFVFYPVKQFAWNHSTIFTVVNCYCSHLLTISLPHCTILSFEACHRSPLNICDQHWSLEESPSSSLCSSFELLALGTEHKHKHKHKHKRKH